MAGLTERNISLLLIVFASFVCIVAVDFRGDNRQVLADPDDSKRPLGGGLPPVPEKGQNFDKARVDRPGLPIHAQEPHAQEPVRTLDDEAAKPKKERMKISESKECSNDVKMLCPEKASSNNFAILECLQDDEKTAGKLTDDCHNFLWRFKLKLTKDSRFEEASNEACAAEFAKFTECKGLDQGEPIPCLLENYDKIKSKPCSIFLNKMASIIFSDYRLTGFFAEACKKDIGSLKCGRLESTNPADDDSPHSQGKTITCLRENRRNLNKSCKKALLRMAELQSDDFHLDRPLYYACKGDRENLCHNVVAGEGAVFKCLYNHLGDDKLSDNCRARLEERQQLIAEDVKADKSFYTACKEDINNNKCVKKLRAEGDYDDDDSDYSRSSILLCLEETQSKSKNIKPECLREMFELRSQLMQDYKISPELVDACKDEITEHCNGLKQGGNTLKCLMKKASQKNKLNKFSKECKDEVTKLLQVVNPGENIRLDAPLQRACGDVVSQTCSQIRAGQGDVITCLLEHLDHKSMTDECEDELMVIQYFAARDFRLDTHLFRQCQADAVKLCSYSGFSDPASVTKEQGDLVFSCLHRHLRSNNPDDKKPSRSCIHEIKRVQRERTMRINLMPEVETACMGDLSDHCSDKNEHTEVGAEMACLQLHFDKLSDTCRTVVANFTMEQTDDIEMDKILMRSCTPMIKRFCSDLLNSDAIPNEILDCLIEHKNQNAMDEKCAAGIEHHQIISLKDFRFNMKFRDACQKSVAKLCRNKKTKYEVIACLSEHVRNDTLLETPQRIDERCKRQLKAELLQRGESVNLDPELKTACEEDIHKHCANKRDGEGEILECLRTHKKQLSTSCHRVLFLREKDDAMFGDYTLLHVCKKMIMQYCETDADEADILNCLKEKRNYVGFNDKCRQVIHQRQLEQAQDFRLNPHLLKACRLDIPKYCSLVYTDAVSRDEEIEGKVINCLKKKYAARVTSPLTKSCEREIQSRIKEAALDINLNPVLLKSCEKDIKTVCVNEIADIINIEMNSGYGVFGEGRIMECLKRNFGKLKDHNCREEVAIVIAESRIDVHVDPLLQAACQESLLANCRDVPQGLGRQMSCLLSSLESSPDSLTTKCRDMLKSRKKLWETAAEVAPVESFSEVYDQMSASPARNYFIAVVFTAVGLIFIIGLTCGRVTKRVRAQLKNK